METRLSARQYTYGYYYDVSPLMMGLMIAVVLLVCAFSGWGNDRVRWVVVGAILLLVASVLLFAYHPV